MSDSVDPIEQRKAAFIREYSQLCKRHRLAVIRIEEDNYTSFAVAHLSPYLLEVTTQEMLINGIKTVSKE